MHAKHTFTTKLFIIYLSYPIKCFCSVAKTWSVGRGFSTQNPVLGGAARATPGTRKTPFLGLPKSRPSPLQKCAKNGVFGRKSVHFRSICAQFCTKMTSFLRT